MGSVAVEHECAKKAEIGGPPATAIKRCVGERWPIPTEAELNMRAWDIGVGD
jgi:hypothetical protein